MLLIFNKCYKSCLYNEKGVFKDWVGQLDGTKSIIHYLPRTYAWQHTSVSREMF